MKNIITIIALLITSFCNAQIEVKEASKHIKVGEVKGAGRIFASLYYTVKDTDSLYIFTFWNAKYQTLNDYKILYFIDKDGTVDKLYSVFKGFFSEENKKNKDYKLDLKLGDNHVFLSTNKGKAVMIWYDNGYISLTEKEIDKLFGK